MDIIYEVSNAQYMVPKTFNDKITHTVIDAKLVDVICTHTQTENYIWIQFKFIGNHNNGVTISISLNENYKNRFFITRNFIKAINYIIQDNKSNIITEDEIIEMCKKRCIEYKYIDIDETEEE